MVQGTTPRWVALEHIISLLNVTLEPRLSWDDLLDKSLSVDARPHDKQAADARQRKGRLTISVGSFLFLYYFTPA